MTQTSEHCYTQAQFRGVCSPPFSENESLGEREYGGTIERSGDYSELRGVIVVTSG